MAAPQKVPSSTFTEVGVPSLGMDTDTVPRLIDKRKAPLLKNFLMDRPGVLPMRGPLCEGVSWNLGASIGLQTAWVLGDKLLVSRAAASGTNTTDFWTELYRPVTSFTTRGGQPTVYVIDLKAGTTASFALWAAPPTWFPAGRSVQVGKFAYGIASIRNTSVTATDGRIYSGTTVARWDGGSTASSFAYYLSGPIYGCQDIAFHYNRLFVFGGLPPGTAGTSPPPRHALYWSDLLATDATTALPDTLAAWQDDVSGLVNQIVVGNPSESDPPVALAHVGPNLALLKRRSLYVLYGTSPSNFQVKQISNDVGCIDPRSVVEYDGGVYFMSGRGFMFYDGGAQPRNVSVGLESTLVANALKQVGPQGVDGGYCRATLLDRSYILVTTGVMDGATLTVTADTDSWLLHAPSGAWLQLSSGALPSVIAGGRTANHSYLLTDQKLVKANYLFAPQNAPVGTRGFDSIDGGATKFVIPSRWTTRALSLSTPPRKSKLQRITADYYWGLANGGWQVTTNTRGATGVVNSVGTLPAPAGIAATLPARGAIDTFNETDELYLDIAASSGAPAAFNDAELHRVLVEFTGAANVPASL